MSMLSLYLHVNQKSDDDDDDDDDESSNSIVFKLQPVYFLSTSL